MKKQFSFLKFYHTAIGGAYEALFIGVNYFPEIVGLASENEILFKLEVVYGNDFRNIYKIDLTICAKCGTMKM